MSDTHYVTVVVERPQDRPDQLRAILFETEFTEHYGEQTQVLDIIQFDRDPVGISWMLKLIAKKHNYHADIRLDDRYVQFAGRKRTFASKLRHLVENFDEFVPEEEMED